MLLLEGIMQENLLSLDDVKSHF